MRRKISKAAINQLKPDQLLADTEIRGFVARCLPSGVVTYGLRYRVMGKQRWLGLGLHGRITPEKARQLAKMRIGEVAASRDPVAERQSERVRGMDSGATTVDGLLDVFLDRHVRKNLRTADNVERIFARCVRPHIGAKPLGELRRSDVTGMLDAIDDGRGPVMADRTLAHLRKAFNWWAARDDSFVPPIVRGMARTKPSERARKRVLDDDEICDVWAALDCAKVRAPYPRLVRTLLLSAQRRNEVARMQWHEVSGSTWTIPGERRKTAVDGVVPLTREMMHLLDASKKHKKGYAFSTNGGRTPFSGFGKAKLALDEAINHRRKQEGRPPMPPWVLHDLRRTARSLMSRAHVPADIGERVLGHAIPGVRGVYDRHPYDAEKRDALEKLAALVTAVLKRRSPAAKVGKRSRLTASPALAPGG